MKTQFALLSATAMLALATGAAFAADDSATSDTQMQTDKNGGYDYKHTTSQTTPDDTTTKTETEVNKDVDSNGLTDKTVTRKSSTDPKGLMNKKTRLAKTEIKEKERGGYKQTTIRKYTDANGTSYTYKTVTDVDVDSKGNVTTTATTKKTVDPKGLFNPSTTTTTKTKSVNGHVVEDKTDSN